MSTVDNTHPFYNSDAPLEYDVEAFQTKTGLPMALAGFIPRTANTALVLYWDHVNNTLKVDSILRLAVYRYVGPTKTWTLHKMGPGVWPHQLEGLVNALCVAGGLIR